MSIETSVQEVEVVALAMEPPLALDFTVSVRDAIRQMRDAQTGCALICAGDRLRGIFTERDVLNKVVGIEGILDQTVSEVMTSDPDCVFEDDPIRKAVLAMYNGGFRNVPVVDFEGRVVSCVRHKDIVHYLVQHFAQHVLNLPPDPENMPKTRNGG